ncbi:hypothetical protein PROFUN_04575 [Planoprotostelium fungivorum]|uniref:Uncharacterized protein n=1 Tax=Planoprotostelium fungivorum TaxID=1890364 RepID=A0A2P6NBL3_9EUKA|nr:hypothetical protein PROFUN_04575 [Planoprotostelium fungivorum]
MNVSDVNHLSRARRGDAWCQIIEFGLVSSWTPLRPLKTPYCGCLSLCGHETKDSTKKQ